MPNLANTTLFIFDLRTDLNFLFVFCIYIQIKTDKNNKHTIKVAARVKNMVPTKRVSPLYGSTSHKNNIKGDLLIE